MTSSLFKLPTWGDDVPSTSFSFKKKQNKHKNKTNDSSIEIAPKPKATSKAHESSVKKEPKKKNKTKSATRATDNNAADSKPGRFVLINSQLAGRKSHKTKLGNSDKNVTIKKRKFDETSTNGSDFKSKKAKKNPNANSLAGSKKAQAAIKLPFKGLKVRRESIDDDEDDEELANDVLLFRNSLMGKLKAAGPAAVTFSDSEAESIDLEKEGASTNKKSKSTKIDQRPLNVAPAKVQNNRNGAISGAEELVDRAAVPSFREKLVGNLKGSRFRFLNEILYSTEGAGGMKLFKEDKGAFKAYHEGYRQQVQQWPLNPLDRIIKSIKKLPKTHVIADFGCGEGRLAGAIPHKTYSLDLVANRHEIIACDMAKTPLETSSIDVAVYCLSLMGTNLRDFILEANRVLKTGGHLKIAEVESRFDNVRQFIDNVKACGFQLASQDVSNKLFVFINFKKVQNVDKTNKRVPAFSLKPCLYKKR